MDVSRNQKLFRAIVVMGAAIATPACDVDDDCGECLPIDARPDSVAVNDAPVTDAGVDAVESQSDAMVDAFVAIL